MVNYKLAKVRAEIERRRNRHSKAKRIESALEDNAILSFIDSMQKEPKECMYSKDNYTDEDRKVLCDGCEEECKYVPPVFDEGYWEKLGEEHVSEDLEEVSKKYSSCIYLEEVLSDDDKEVLREKLINTFKAGANWKKQKMLAKAIDAKCFGFQNAALFSFRLPAKDYLVGSQIKVIVIMEN